MIALHLLYELPGALSAALILSRVSPWRVTQRMVPVLLFASALLVLALPQFIGLALCLVLAGGVVASWLGMEFAGQDPVAVKVPSIPRLRRPKIKVTEFAGKAYPDPGAVEDDADPEPETVSDVPRYVTPL